MGGARPCPWMGCKYHLAVDAKPSGGIAFYWPVDHLHDAPATCCLDVADLGGVTLEMIAACTGLTRERIRQIEVKALDAAREHAQAMDCSEMDPGE